MVNKEVRDARHEQEQLEALHRLDEECVHLQRAGNYLQAFDNMERALVLRRHFFGADSPEVTHACRALAEMCNLLSMSFLQQDNFPVTLELLKKAEILAQKHPKEKATTLNNLACYYRRLGKLHTAMTCLKKALAIETKTLKDPRNAADTHLNICAVLSQLGKHQQALDHAQAALLTLQEEFFQKPQKTSTATSSEELQTQTQSQQLERVSVMCIAYHNMGVEQEFLQDFDGCVLSYKKGVGLAEQYLGVDHAIATTIRNSYLAAKRTISTKASHHQRSPVGGGGKGGGGGGAMATRVARVATPPSSLRLPSPITKTKTQHKPQQPTRDQEQLPSLSPRSIVADALARGNTLPPLDQRTKNKNNSTLTPEDPFFSPRFQFDTRTKMKNKNKNRDENKNKNKEENTNEKSSYHDGVDDDKNTTEQTAVSVEQKSERNADHNDVAPPAESTVKDPAEPLADVVEASSANDTRGVAEETVSCEPTEVAGSSAQSLEEEPSPVAAIAEDTIHADPSPLQHPPPYDGEQKETEELRDDEGAQGQELQQEEEVGGDLLLADDGGDAIASAAAAVDDDDGEEVGDSVVVAATTLLVVAPAEDGDDYDQQQQHKADHDDDSSHPQPTEEEPLVVAAVAMEEEEPAPQQEEESPEAPEEEVVAANGDSEVTATGEGHFGETEYVAWQPETETQAQVAEGTLSGGESDAPAQDEAVAWQTPDDALVYAAEEGTPPWDGSHVAAGEDPYGYAYPEDYAHADDHVYDRTEAVVTAVDSSYPLETEYQAMHEGDQDQLPEVQQHEWQTQEQDWQSTPSHGGGMADDDSAWQPPQDQPLREEAEDQQLHDGELVLETEESPISL